MCKSDLTYYRTNVLDWQWWEVFNGLPSASRIHGRLTAKRIGAAETKRVECGGLSMDL
jgi:uncharacterized protein YmfQ (DUF2313 family)